MIASLHPSAWVRSAHRRVNDWLAKWVGQKECVSDGLWVRDWEKWWEGDPEALGRQHDADDGSHPVPVSASDSREVGWTTHAVCKMSSTA